VQIEVTAGFVDRLVKSISKI